VEACAALLRALADDEQERIRYGGALRDRWRREFSIERHCERLDEVYRRVVTER
jgi:glycosyltransferase involved in cell wall biosynthesis